MKICCWGEWFWYTGGPASRAQQNNEYQILHITLSMMPIIHSCYTYQYMYVCIYKITGTYEPAHE